MEKKMERINFSGTIRKIKDIDVKTIEISIEATNPRQKIDIIRKLNKLGLALNSDSEKMVNIILTIMPDFITAEGYLSKYYSNKDERKR
jgi:hypothetical protein